MSHSASTPAAARPVVFTVDDDPAVLRAVARDLRTRYSDNYRILRAPSGDNALKALQELRVRETPVALLLADQRMPGMAGTEFLEKASSLYPGAKRALLTAYADTSAAIDAINRANLDYYLLKPWDPPKERLYPTLDDLLADWRSGYRPAFHGLRVVGSQWSAESHRIKEFLARNQVPYRWLDVETSDDAQTLLQMTFPEPQQVPDEEIRVHEKAATGQTGKGAVTSSSYRLPVVFFPDGEPAVRPSNAVLADRVGLKTRAADPFYDLVVVGAGPSGLAAAVYGASEGLQSLLIEREAPGGQAGTSSRIENYLGFPAGLSGADLARRASAQAQKFGVEILTPQGATALSADGPYRYVTLADGSEVASHALVVACSGDDVFIVGAGNSAGQAALYLAEYARKVIMLVRGTTLTKSMSMYLVERIQDHPNIHVALHTELREVHGERHVERITLIDNRTQETETVDGAAVFLFIGAQPRTEWLGDAIARDARGFIYTGPDLSANGGLRNWTESRDPYLLETSVPGVFATGDVRHGSIKRVAAAVGEGSMAISAVHQYLGDL